VSFGDTRGSGIGVLVFAADVTSPVVGACFPDFFSSSAKEFPNVTLFFFPAEVTGCPLLV